MIGTGYWLDYLKAVYPFTPILATQLVLFLGAASLLIGFRKLSPHRWYRYAVLSLSAGMFLTWSLIFYDYTVDDAYIFLRYARNLGQGAGLTFNLDGSRPVEGYTSFLWTIILTIPYSLKFGDPLPLHFAKIIGILSGLGLLFATSHLCYQVSGSRLASHVAAILISTVPFLAFWSVGGLETPLYLFLCVLAVSIYTYEIKVGKRPLFSVLVLFMAILTRPESLLLAVVLIAQYVLIEIPQRGLMEAIRGILVGSCVLGGLLLFYTWWRYTTYGFLLPNTFYAKRTPLDVFSLFRRLYELLPFILWLLPFASFGWISLSMRDNGTHKPLLLGPLLAAGVIPFTAYREWMPGYRYELLLFPFLFVLVADAIGKVLLLFRMSDWRQNLTIFMVFMFLYAYLFLPSERLFFHRNSVTQGMVSSMGSSNPWHPKMGLWLKKYAPEDASLAAWDMGALPYFSELPVVFDIHQEGLLDAHTTHQGYSVEYFLDQQPTFMFLQPLAQVESSKGVMLGFYNSSEFMTEYEPLFSTGRETLYVRKEVNFPQEALTEAERLFPVSSK